jgi:hypothetical protein
MQVDRTIDSWHSPVNLYHVFWEAEVRVASALDDFVNNWQPRQRQSFGMIATLAIRLQNLVSSHPTWGIYDLPSIALGALHLVLEARVAGGRGCSCSKDCCRWRSAPAPTGPRRSTGMR